MEGIHIWLNCGNFHLSKSYGYLDCIQLAMLPEWLEEITTIRTAEFSGSTERASSRSLRAALRFPPTRSMCAYAYISPTAISQV
jgi:hypothetical protein